MDSQEENLVFDEHQDLSSFTLTELSQLLQINYQTSNHYAMQISAADIPSELKHMYQMSKDILESDINDIQSEIQKRNSSITTKNDISSSTTVVFTITYLSTSISSSNTSFISTISSFNG